MSTGHTRCLYIADGKQCETWFPANGKEFCPLHDSLGVHHLEIEEQNQQREFCYQFFKKGVSNGSLEEIRRLDEHISGLQEVVKEFVRKQNLKILTSLAVRREALGHLSDEERRERLKYVPKKTIPKDKLPKEKLTFKKDTEAFFASKGMSAKEMMNTDPDELIARFNAAKKKKEQENVPSSSDEAV